MGRFIFMDEHWEIKM